MSDFLNGIGFASDLEHFENTTGGSPTLRPGYIYIENVEYYVFADVQVTQIDASGVVSGIDCIPGTPYFIVESEDDIEELSVDASGDPYYINVGSVLDTSKNLITDALTSGWVYNYDDDNFDFTEESFAGKYLVYDTAEEFTFNKEFVETTLLVLSENDEGSPFNLEPRPVWLTSGVDGRIISFYVKVIDSNGNLLDDRTISWYKIYTKPEDNPPSGVISPFTYPSGVMYGEEVFGDVYGDIFGNNIYNVRFPGGAVTTDSNGVARLELTKGEYEEDLCIYFQSGNLRSKLIWIQSQIPILTQEGYFQLDHSMLSSQEAMTAMGMDVWGNNWVTASGYDEVPTGITEYPTRGEWKTGYEKYQRPPMDEETTTVSEANGIWNGNDAGLTFNDMGDKYCGVKGYWGHIILQGTDINTGDWDSKCQNPTDDRYIIDFADASTSGYEACEGHFGQNGSWNTAKILNSSKFYVIYDCDTTPYDGSGKNWFKTHEFYFRGLAVPDQDGDQDNLIGSLIGEDKLQQY